MLFRTANLADIPQIQIVRHSVRENTLSDPALVTDQDVAIFLSERGKGWVCEFEGQVIGFAIVDLQDHNIWALFLRPEFEKQGIGRRLQELMLDWYFEQTRETLWLGTAPGTRARVSDHQYRLGRAPIPSFVISFPLLASSLG
ncbi:MAG: GNAT family N-acetyltransferase, partial [Saprospiraceae bacterium]|nr:GNAT family N-acetyltransferase [Saprospiraceae bacterium]